MEDNIKSKFFVSISEGIIEISGSEDFVNKQIENFKDELVASAKNINNTKIATKTTVPKTYIKEGVNIDNVDKKIEKSGGNNLADIYPNVFTMDGDEIKITCIIPGKNNPQKTLNIALIYSYALLKTTGEEFVKIDKIRDVCKDHACYVQKNFSTHIKKGVPNYYLDKGKNSTRTIKLTIPGKREAENIIKTLNGENGE